MEFYGVVQGVAIRFCLKMIKLQILRTNVYNKWNWILLYRVFVSNNLFSSLSQFMWNSIKLNISTNELTKKKIFPNFYENI